jgi:hypothetical protein
MPLSPKLSAFGYEISIWQSKDAFTDNWFRRCLQLWACNDRVSSL